MNGLFLLTLLYMTTISEMYENWRKVKLRKQVPIIIEQNKETLIALNQRQLYIHSEDSKGEPLRFYASSAYALDKERRNSSPGFGRPDLYDTGSFYRSFVVKVSPRFYEITATDSKTKKLTEKYGVDIFGLNEESQTQFVNETLYKGIANYINDLTGLVLS